MPEFTYSDIQVNDLLRWLYESASSPDEWLEPRWNCPNSALISLPECHCNACRWLTGLLRQEETAGHVELDRTDVGPPKFAEPGLPLLPVYSWPPRSRPDWSGMARLTDAGSARAVELLQEDAQLAEAQNDRTEAVLTVLLRWTHQQMTERRKWDEHQGATGRSFGAGRAPAHPAPLWGILQPVDSPMARGLRVSFRDALAAAEHADHESLCIFDYPRIELTGYGTRCVESYGGNYAKMTTAENGHGNTIRMRDGVVVTGTARDVTYTRGNPGSDGSAPSDVTDLAQRIVNLVQEHAEALEQPRLAERDAQEVADELSQPEEDQDRDRIRDALTRLQGRVTGVGALTAAGQELWNRIFGQ
ncbi:hypothetical protein ACIRD8_37095 [Streptomyces sp. NPDC102451]|uniref:hypothetical protein n=1 Tax=Streptomyces sp. NPDC102451 TaxID=3366177 RepID=UPI00382A5C83